ncbi:hypothetical protein OAO01_00640 [Oligoflexia bacterium]|nr:hypothetical protein [Oligoflexia bacterium]
MKYGSLCPLRAIFTFIFCVNVFLIGLQGSLYALPELRLRNDSAQSVNPLWSGTVSFSEADNISLNDLENLALVDPLTNQAYKTFATPVLRYHEDRSAQGGGFGEARSIAMASLNARVPLTAQSELVLEVQRNRNFGLRNFVNHPNVMQWLSNSYHTLDLFVRAGIKDAQGNVEYYLAPFSGAVTNITEEGNKAMLRFRIRNHLYKEGVQPPQESPLSINYFVTFFNNTPYANLEIVFGDDSVDHYRTVGGVEFSAELFVNSANGVIADLVSPESYGVDGSRSQVASYEKMALTPVGSFVQLGTGQQVLIPAVLGFGISRNDSNYQLEVNYSASAMENADYRRTDAAPLGTYLFPNTLTGAQIDQERSTLAQSYQGPVANDPTIHLGAVNQRPPAAASQPDFSDCVSAYHSAAIGLESSALLANTYHKVVRTALRAWHFVEGLSDDVTVFSGPNYKDIGMWMQSIHGHGSYNPSPSVPAWVACYSNNPSQMPQHCRAPHQKNHNGNMSGQDMQHRSEWHRIWQSLLDRRHSWLIYDMLMAGQSEYFFNHFSHYFKNNLDADRATRAMTMAIIYYGLNPTAPAAEMFLGELVGKLGRYLDAIEGNYQQYGVPFVTMRSSVHNSSYPTPQTVAAWENTFVVQMLWYARHFGILTARVEQVMQLYLNSADFFYSATRGSWAYYIDVYTREGRWGGINNSWFFPWIRLAQLFPNHPKSSYLINNAKSEVVRWITTPGNVNPSTAGTSILFNNRMYCENNPTLSTVGGGESAGSGGKSRRSIRKRCKRKYNVKREVSSCVERTLKRIAKRARRQARREQQLSEASAANMEELLTDI